MNIAVVAAVVAAAVLITKLLRLEPGKDAARRAPGKARAAQRAPTGKPREPNRNADIYFMPIGPLPRRHLDAVVHYFRKQTRLRVEVLPMVPVLPEMLEPVRNQLVAEKVIAAALKSLPKITLNPRAVMIGITPMDMFTMERDWKYVYAKREGAHCTVISSARMTLDGKGQRVDEETYLARIRKMVAKTIGLQFYGLDTNWDRNSVMYGNVNGMADIDRIDERTLDRDVLIPGERQRRPAASPTAPR